MVCYFLRSEWLFPGVGVDALHEASDPLVFAKRARHLVGAMEFVAQCRAARSFL